MPRGCRGGAICAMTEQGAPSTAESDNAAKNGVLRRRQRSNAARFIKEFLPRLQVVNNMHHLSGHVEVFQGVRSRQLRKRLCKTFVCEARQNQNGSARSHAVDYPTNRKSGGSPSGTILHGRVFLDPGIALLAFPGELHKDRIIWRRRPGTYGDIGNNRAIGKFQHRS